MQLFYAPDISGNEYTFNQEESRHIIKVLRLNKGDTIHITDGKGNLFKTDIINPDPKKCRVKIVDQKEAYGKRSFYLHIAIAPTKNIKRFEWFLEKCTEMGIDEITPLLCDHSERKHIRNDRMNKVLTAAMKQSIKAYHPKLNGMIALKDFLANTSNEANSLHAIAICDETEKPHLKNLCGDKENVVMIIGPEGDFSEEEITQAKAKNYIPVSLSESRLRTETAGVVACNIVHITKE